MCFEVEWEVMGRWNWLWLVMGRLVFLGDLEIFAYKDIYFLWAAFEVLDFIWNSVSFSFLEVSQRTGLNIFWSLWIFFFSLSRPMLILMLKLVVAWSTNVEVQLFCWAGGVLASDRSFAISLNELSSFTMLLDPDWLAWMLEPNFSKQTTKSEIICFSWLHEFQGWGETGLILIQTLTLPELSIPIICWHILMGL